MKKDELEKGITITHVGEETLEDLLNKKANQSSKVDLDAYANGLDDGYELAKKIMYSEEEVLNILYKHTEDLLAGKKLFLEDWFNKIKKK